VGIDERSIFAGNPVLAKATCDRDPRALNLVDGRFDVVLEWAYGSRRGEGMALDGTDDSGFFMAPTSSPGQDGAEGEEDVGAGDELAERQHPDWAIKVLDGRPINGHFWIFSTPLSGFGGKVTVIDTSTGIQRELEHDPGTLCLRAQLSHPR
jgi:hypothetical protein